jgi:hypothetical protein
MRRRLSLLGEGLLKSGLCSREKFVKDHVGQNTFDWISGAQAAGGIVTVRVERVDDKWNRFIFRAWEKP